MFRYLEIDTPVSKSLYVLNVVVGSALVATGGWIPLCMAATGSFLVTGLYEAGHDLVHRKQLRERNWVRE